MNAAERQLRERYLDLWLQATQDKPHMTFYMHGHTQVKGVFCSTDSENNRFRVDQLASPLGLYERVTLRGTDIDRIEYSLKKE
ncbi:hypothetical protein A0J61_09656 [Choanephora cucurbitarum]|uniref:Gem-associated protein 7 n=1 Tax=Choanephora cucurbitarum TaxID=101091 RepID=A0A1C7N4Q6_9FUNG|nr:hypothetical protein A0J61_09656 [Choanephora cucurbitarum]